MAVLEACGPGSIPGDPEAIRAIADALERGSRDAEEIAELIRLAGATALAGWDAPSAQGYEAFCAEALTCAHGLIDVGPAAAGPLRAYATELEAAQRAFAGAVADERSAERGLDSAERGSRAEHTAEADLDEARGAKASAFEAALAANQRAARQIQAIANGVPAAPAAPVPPAAVAQERPWYEDFAAWELEQGLGVFKGAWEGTVAIAGGATMFYRLSLTNALLDTDSFLEQWSDLGRAAEYAWDNPLEFGKALINWEDLSAGRYGEWLGNLVPDALLAIGTAGAGTAASRSLRGAKALEEFGDVAAGAAPAARRLEGAARGTDAVRLPPSHSFGNPARLNDHFQRHGADFDAGSANDYANQASEFLQGSQRDGLPTKIDAEGVIRAYDPNSNTFGAYNPDGTTRTFFKPSSPTYFNRQPGSPPQP